MSNLPRRSEEELAALAVSARAARVASLAEAKARQLAGREVVDGYTIQPAIGRTGGAENVGWELIPPRDVGPDWYLATRQLAIEAIPRHRARYA